MIKQNVIELLRNSKVGKARLQIALDKAAPTVQRYLDDNDIMLTTAKALEVIKTEFNLTELEILETENVA
jgi:hypothetical protein